MFVPFLASSVLLKNLRKAFILFWLLGVLSCKDLKSWQSIYGRKVKITFEPEKDEQLPQVLKDLQTAKLSQLYFVKKPIVTDNDKNVSLNSLSIPLDPDTDAVSFELESKDSRYYHKVTIHYQRISSLISPKAGGLQVQYVIKHIQLHAKGNKRPVFKKYTIENPVPLQEEQAHVTLYY